MLDVSKYIVDGKVDRAHIVFDIRDCRLSESEIRELAKNPDIQDSFFGGEFGGKKPRDQWDKKYLENIVCAAVGESFNEEYLLYLNEVARYVNRSQKKNSFNNSKLYVAVGIAVFAVIVVGVVVLR
ncbi:MAG: hypothetical protein LUC98_12480 [Lachnospiraceae bacterium]|nr:hypothetical protein [Lachnospiraceae bacterium]